MSRKRKTTRTAHRAKRVTLGVLAGAALVSGVGVGVPGAHAVAPNSAANQAHQLKSGVELPGPGEVIDGISKVIEFLDVCKKNEAAGRECTASEFDILNGLDKKLDDYIAQYSIDQDRNKDAINAVAVDVKNAQAQSEILAVTSDFSRAASGMNIYRSMVDCATAFAGASHGPEGNPSAARCERTDSQGNADGSQVANLQALEFERDAFMRSQDPSKYKVDANDMLNRVSGIKRDATKNPYDKDRLGILNKIVDRDRGAEKAALGISMTDPLHFMGPDYVNKVGTDVTSIINAESTYFTVRAIQQKFAGPQPGQTGNEFANAAERGGSGGEMSIADQRKTYTFPGWSTQNQMKSTDAYVQMKDGSYVKITNQGSSVGAPKPGLSGLLSPEQMAQITDVMGPISSRGKAKLQAAYPGLLPARSGTAALGNAPGEAQRDDAAARWWTTPQQTWGAEAEYGRKKVNLLGPNLQAVQLEHGFKEHYKTRALSGAELSSTSVPYSIFNSPTDTIRGTHFARINIGKTPFEQYCGKPWTCDGPRHVYEIGMGKMESTDAVVQARAESTNFRGVTAYQSPTWDSFRGAAGLGVRTSDITAANVTATPVATAGLFVGA